MVIMETWAKPGEVLNRQCLHLEHMPLFNAEACRTLSPAQVKEQYPRFDATCATCGQQCRIWADMDHVKALGDG